MEAIIGETIIERKIDGCGNSIYQSFVDVINMKNYHRLVEGLDTNHIIKSMNLMTLKNKEKGSCVCKFNTLNGK